MISEYYGDIETLVFCFELLGYTYIYMYMYMYMYYV